MMIAEQELGPLSLDAFLGGRLMIWQPRRGYRAGIDPVLLAASVPARPGQAVLELGCGAGVAALCLAARVPGLALTGLELQPAYAALARRNAAENGMAFEVIEGDLGEMPAALRAVQFDHVIANPPYFEAGRRHVARDSGKETALAGNTPLADWLGAAARRCAPGGHVSLIQRTERLPDLLCALPRALGSIQVLPLLPRAGRDARLVLLRARKGGRAPFRLHHGWLLHQGATHEDDREDYTPATSAVLREGSALPFPD